MVSCSFPALPPHMGQTMRKTHADMDAHPLLLEGGLYKPSLTIGFHHSIVNTRCQSLVEHTLSSTARVGQLWKWARPTTRSLVSVTVVFHNCSHFYFRSSLQACRPRRSRHRRWVTAHIFQREAFLIYIIVGY